MAARRWRASSAVFWPIHGRVVVIAAAASKPRLPGAKITPRRFRPANDLTYRFPLIVESVAWLRSRSCIIDGEAVVCNRDRVPSFDHIRYRRHDSSAFLYAFDLIELNDLLCFCPPHPNGLRIRLAPGSFPSIRF